MSGSLGAVGWEQVGVVVGVLSPLVGVPLTMITLYLRAIREQQTSTNSELLHRIETIEGSLRDLTRAMGEFEREYATKEEWVRESMLARQRLERLTEMATRIQAELETGHNIATELGRAMAAIVETAREREKRVNAAD